MRKNKFISSTITALGLAALLTVPANADGYDQPSKDIVDTAVASGSFDTLVAAVQAAGLVDALKAEGPLTVFAPTDEAFAQLPEGTVDNLLKPENKDQLVQILTYHVVPGRLTASEVTSMAGTTTLQGEQITFKVDNGKVYVDGAEVIQADVSTSNGVIHIIDQVILPGQGG